MTLATRLLAATPLALSLALAAASCTSIVGDFQVDPTICWTSSDCPQPASACAVARCGPDRVCKQTFIAAGTPCTVSCATCDLSCSGGPATCGACDGAGHCIQCVTDDECPVAPTGCASARCVNDACSVELAPVGQKCPTGVCTAQGTCAECNGPSDCPPEKPVCLASNQCTT